MSIVMTTRVRLVGALCLAALAITVILSKISFDQYNQSFKYAYFDSNGLRRELIVGIRTYRRLLHREYLHITSLSQPSHFCFIRQSAKVENGRIDPVPATNVFRPFFRINRLSSFHDVGFEAENNTLPIAYGETIIDEEISQEYDEPSIQIIFYECATQQNSGEFYPIIFNMNLPR
jgi:hypothetical protein